MDSYLKDLIQDDWKIFDNIETLRLVHRTTQEVDFDLKSLSTASVVEEVEGCLVRQVAQRQSGSVRQVFEKGKSITADNFQFSDTIIEVPIKVGRVIEVDDTFEKTECDGTTKRWQVLALDFATLRTRHRIGCRNL